MNAEEISRRLAGLRPSRRGAPPAGGAGRPRGDHDLNPDLFDPAQALIPAAVLVPIVAREAGLTVLLTRRTQHLDVHAGQISFPGGRIEPGEGPREAALREAEEEVGLARRYVRILGRLDTYVVRTGFEVEPVVGLVTPPFPIEADPFEVAEVFEVPLEFFLVPGNRQRESRLFRGKRRHFFAFAYEGYYIWGATAGMLVNLVEILGPPEATAHA